MRILFVQLPTSHRGSGERVYPLGLARLAAGTAKHHVSLALDMNLMSDPWPALREKLEQLKPELIALSFRNIDPLAGIQASYVSSLQTGARLCRLLAKQATIVVGGPAFSLFAEPLMACIPEIDFGLVGEGEAVFPQILESLSAPQTIPGLIWRQGSSLIRNPPAAGLDLDRLPSLIDSPFCPADYLKGNSYVAAIGIEGKRGCDLNCGYCVYPRLGGGRMRLRPPQQIVDEMEMLHHEHGVSLFHFTDSVVNRPLDHFDELCRKLIARKMQITWTGFFREDTFSEAIAALAKKAGLIACYFSADALSDHGLQLLNKRMTKQDVLQASQVTVRHDILTMCHFLVNLPFETASHVREAFDTMSKILDIHSSAGNLGAVIFNTVRLYPGAPLTRLLIKEHLLLPETNLLYPVYFNPAPSAHVLHELEALCHTAGVYSQLHLPLI